MTFLDGCTARVALLSVSVLRKLCACESWSGQGFLQIPFFIVEKRLERDEHLELGNYRRPHANLANFIIRAKGAWHPCLRRS